MCIWDVHINNPVYDRERAEQVWTAAYNGEVERLEEMARTDLVDWWDIDHPKAEEPIAVVDIGSTAHAVFSREHADALEEAGANVPEAVRDGWAINLPRVVDVAGWPKHYTAAIAHDWTTIEDELTGFRFEADFAHADRVLCDAGRRHLYAEHLMRAVPHEVAHNLSTVYHDRLPETYGDRVVAEFFGCLANELYRDPMEYVGEEDAISEFKLRQGHAGGIYLASHALKRGDDPAELVRLSNEDILDRYRADLDAIHEQYDVPVALDDPDIMHMTEEERQDMARDAYIPH